MDQPQDVNMGAKRRKITTFSEDTCCFCKKTFNHNKVILDPSKCDFLFAGCKDKSTDIALKLVANEDSIRNGEIRVVYHKACRSKFLHPFYKTENVVVNKTNEQHADSNKLTRSQLKCAKFNWKDNCFICGEKCSIKHRGKWSKIEGSIDETSRLYLKLLNMSSQNGNDVLHSRLLSSHGDLVAVEARYHRKKGCLAKYLSSNPEMTEPSSSRCKSDLDKACEHLKMDLFDAVEKQNSVYDLSKIKDLILDIAKLKQLNVDQDKLNGKQIKRVLKRVWPDLMHISRKGPCSDLICSKSLQVKDALCKFVQLQKNLEAVSEQNELESSLIDSFENSEENELSILHNAASILRNRILKKIAYEKSEYFASEEMTIDSQTKFLDTHIKMFVRWLSGHSEETCYQDISLTKQELSLCSDITYLVNPMTTPKHLGLSIYLHHSFGSKKLIEDLHSHGYILSYSAVHMASIQNRTKSGIIISYFFIL